MKLIAIFSLMAALTFGADKAADAVKAAEKSWATATVADDEATLQKLLADDLTYTHSTGDHDNKTAFIGNLKGVRKYVKLNHESMDVRVYGNAAVVTAKAMVETSMNGAAPAPAHLQFIHVWILKGGQWQLVAHQSLRLAK